MAELSIDIHGVSYHAGGGSEFRQVNPGVGVRYEQAYDGTLLSVIAGRYINSINRHSDYVFIGKGWSISDNVSAGVMAGYITGYESKAIAAITPYFRAGAVTLTVAPPAPNSPAVIAASITINIGDMSDFF